MNLRSSNFWRVLRHNEQSARQGYFIQASSAEEAWERMAIRYPEETSVGFTVQDWEGFNVVIKEVKRDC